jgi:hypothetical protein
MKKFLFGLTVFGLAVVFAFPVSAAVTVSADRVIDGQEVTPTCTGFYGFYDASSLKQGVLGACGTPASPGLGVWKVVETAADQTGKAYVELTVTSSTDVQVTPDFSDPDVANSVTGSAATGLVTGIGSFLVSQLPALLTVLACLIGLGFLLVRVRRWIGKRA